MDFKSFLITIATLFILLIVGFIAGKRNIIDSVASKKLSSLIINIGQPALIISSIVSQPYTHENFILGLKTLLLGFGVHLFMGAIAYVVCIKIKHMDERKILEFSMVFGNTGFIGIPILGALFPETGAFQASFIVISFNILLWTLGMSILGRGRNDIKMTPKKALINRGTIPSIIGLAIFLLPAIPLLNGFSLATNLPFAADSIRYLSSLCTPISMLIIGALLSTVSLGKAFTSGKIYFLCLFKLLVIPLTVCFVMKLGSLFLPFDPAWIRFATALTAMPSATAVSMYAELYDIAPKFSAQGVGMTSLLSVATMPVVVAVAQLVSTL